MSPEQTGRMNRHVDFRSDFYSLGMQEGGTGEEHMKRGEEWMVARIGAQKAS